MAGHLLLPAVAGERLRACCGSLKFEADRLSRVSQHAQNSWPGIWGQLNKSSSKMANMFHLGGPEVRKYLVGWGHKGKGETKEANINGLPLWVGHCLEMEQPDCSGEESSKEQSIIYIYISVLGGGVFWRKG